MTEIHNIEIVSRKQARKLGLKHYFTGKPCLHGHISKRNTKDVHCLGCTKEKSLKYGKKLRQNDYVRYKLYQEKHKKAQRKASLEWRAKNPDKVREYKRREAKKNREKRKKIQAIWNKKFPEKVKSYKTNAKAKRRNSVGAHTAADILFLMKKQKNRCAECKCKISHKPKNGEIKSHLDHIMPIALGGSNDKRNLQFLCWSCNLSKGAKHPAEWARQNNRLI